MGLLEPDGRCRGEIRRARLSLTGTVIVHNLAQARAAIAAARDLGTAMTLSSAPDAAASAGPAWFQALNQAAKREWPDGPIDAILDCGAEAGAVLAGLRAGVKRLRFHGNHEITARLSAIAAQHGAVIEDATNGPVLDLLAELQPHAACKAFLTRNGNSP